MHQDTSTEKEEDSVIQKHMNQLPRGWVKAGKDA